MENNVSSIKEKVLLLSGPTYHRSLKDDNTVICIPETNNQRFDRELHEMYNDAKKVRELTEYLKGQFKPGFYQGCQRTEMCPNERGAFDTEVELEHRHPY
jgi:hypothetical protein